MAQKEPFGPFEPFGPLGIATQIFGALQIATLLAKPLPTYGEGTDNAAGGTILVGEKKKGNGYEPELVQPVNDKPFWTSRPMLLNGLKGAKITPLSKMSDNLNAAMYNNMISATASLITGGATTNELAEIKEAIERTGFATAAAIKRQKAGSVTVNVHGSWGAYIDKNVKN